MPKDDEAARKSRAESLRRQIAELKGEQTKTGKEKESSKTEESHQATRGGRSPRDFIRERMRELDEKEEREE